MFWIFLIIALIAFSWLFLFVYKHVYFTMVQEVAIINLKSQLVITKVQKSQFNTIVANYEVKKNPALTIDFQKLNNPFKGFDATAEEAKK